MAYLKKHAIAHQMPAEHPEPHYIDAPMPINNFNLHMPIRNYPQITGHFAAMLPEIEKHHFNKLREFYFQQSERLSAFQYVRNNELEKFNKT